MPVGLIFLTFAAMDNPYIAPAQQVQPPPNMAMIEPSAIKTFGVLHVIFGVLGVLSAVFGLVFVVSVGPIFDFLAQSLGDVEGGGEETANLMSLTGEMYKSMRPYYLISSLVSGIVVVFLLRAGVFLLKRKKGAEKASSLWAMIAIAVAIISLPVSLFYVIPHQNDFQNQINESLGMGGTTGATGGTFEVIGTIIGVVIGFVVSVIYPSLALYFLKRKKVTDYLAVHGT